MDRWIDRGCVCCCFLCSTRRLQRADVHLQSGCQVGLEQGSHRHEGSNGVTKDVQEAPLRLGEPQRGSLLFSASLCENSRPEPERWQCSHVLQSGPASCSVHSNLYCTDAGICRSAHFQSSQIHLPILCLHFIFWSVYVLSFVPPRSWRVFEEALRAFQAQVGSMARAEGVRWTINDAINVWQINWLVNNLLTALTSKPFVGHIDQPAVPGFCEAGQDGRLNERSRTKTFSCFSTVVCGSSRNQSTKVRQHHQEVKSPSFYHKSLRVKSPISLSEGFDLKLFCWTASLCSHLLMVYMMSVVIWWP